MSGAESNAEFQRLVSQLYKDGSADDGGDMYQQLMRKEGRVLDLVNRVVNQSRDDAVKGGEFLHMPLLALLQRYYAAMRAVFQDLLRAATPRDLRAALFREDRGIYVGVSLVLVALFLLLIQGDR